MLHLYPSNFSSSFFRLVVSFVLDQSLVVPKIVCQLVVFVLVMLVPVSHILINALIIFSSPCYVYLHLDHSSPLSHSIKMFVLPTVSLL
jgi:hypothetical protein